MAISGTLLVTHALGGMDTGDEEGRDDEGGNADQERGHVEGQNDRPGDLDGDRADVVGLGIEAHEAREVLEGDEAQAQGPWPGRTWQTTGRRGAPAGFWLPKP